MSKLKTKEFAHDESGQRIVVIRPRTRELAELAVALGKKAFEARDQELFQSIPRQIKDYTFVGWLSRGKGLENQCFVLNRDGSIREMVKPGDSFISENDLNAFEKKEEPS